MENVSRDEQRHIGFGVKLLSDLVKEDPECKDAVADLLRDALPMMTARVRPAELGPATTCESSASTIEDIYEEGMQSLEQKLRAAGIPLDELPGPDADPARHVVRRARQARRSRCCAPASSARRSARPRATRRSVAMLFDQVRAPGGHARHANAPMTIQWDFTDAEPWHVRVDNGDTRRAAGPRRARRRDLPLHFEDWVDVAAGRDDPRLAMLKGKVRPKGSLKALWQTQKMFAT